MCVYLALMLSSDPPYPLVGAFLSRVLWAGLGTPSLPCHQTTSFYLEVSPQRERRWVSLTLLSLSSKWSQLLHNDLLSEEHVFFRWRLAVLCEQKWMEAFQTQSHRETKVILILLGKFVHLWITFQLNGTQMWMCVIENVSRKVYDPRAVCLQAVAHSMLRSRWRSVCVWRMRQQPVISSQSCKLQHIS